MSGPLIAMLAFMYACVAFCMSWMSEGPMAGGDSEFSWLLFSLFILLPAIPLALWWMK